MTAFRYDGDGRLVERTDPAGRTTRYTRTQHGARVSVAVAVGDAPPTTTTDEESMEPSTATLGDRRRRH